MKGKPRKCTVRGRTRWYVDAPDSVTGKRKRTLFETQAAADDYQQVVNLQPPPTRMLHALVDPDVTLDRYAAEWFFRRIEAFKTDEPGAWRPGTQRSYAQHLTLRLCPFPLGPGPDDTLGRVKVRDLKGGHVEALVAGMRRHGFARGTVRVTLLLFTMILDDAVHRGLLPSHPITRTLRATILAPYLQTPKGARPAPKAFTEEQLQRFLAASCEHRSRFDALWRVGFCTGLRLGELLGLQLDDDQMQLVNGQRVRRLHVERSRDTNARTGDPRTGPTKSGSDRWIDVGPDLGVLLDRLKAERKRETLRHGWGRVPPWLFVTRNGTPLGQSDVRGEFTRILQLAGLDGLDLSPHSMRHTFASLAIARGVNPKWLQGQMGHGRIGTTLDVYANHFDLYDAVAAGALGATILGNAPLVGNTAGNSTGV